MLYRKRQRERFRNCTQKKKHFAHIGASFSNLQTTEKQLNYRAYVPVNGQQYRIIKYKKHKYTMAYQEYEWYEKGNIDVGRFKGKYHNM